MYKISVCTNGVRIISKKMKARESAALGIMLGTGGRFEEDRIKGAAHFLEHILFKGSRRYSCTQIKESIEGVGGSLNAFTAEEKTCYYAKIPAAHLERTFKVLADMVTAPLITTDDVNKERAVILEEIKMYHDLPHYYVLDLLDGLMWPKHPLGKSLVGTHESISRMEPQDLKGFRDAQYVPHNTVVAACGNIHHQDLVDLTDKIFGKIHGSPLPVCTPALNRQDKPRTHFSRRPIEQMHLALGELALPEEHPDRDILNLLHVILGGNMSSRLFNEVREKRGLAYSIATSVKYLKDTGMFLVRAGVDNQKIVETVDLIKKEIRTIQEKGVTPDELKRAKDYYLGQVLLGLEDTLDHMLWISDSLLSRGTVRTVADIVKAVHKVKIKDVQRVARQIFSEQGMNLSVVGPLTDGQERDLLDIMGTPAGA